MSQQGSHILIFSSRGTSCKQRLDAPKIKTAWWPVRCLLGNDGQRIEAIRVQPQLQCRLRLDRILVAEQLRRRYVMQDLLAAVNEKPQ